MGAAYLRSVGGLSGDGLKYGFGGSIKTMDSGANKIFSYFKYHKELVRDFALDWRDQQVVI